MLRLFIVALFMSTAAHANEPLVLPEGVTCSDLFWYEGKGRINAKYLSDMQKCQLASRYADKNSGTFGQFLWVRIEGEYFSVNKIILQSSFRKEEDALKAFEIEIRRQHKAWKRGQ